MTVDSTSIIPNAIHEDLIAAKELVYDKCGFECSPPKKEAESADYGAYTMTIDGMSVKYRVAKITPTKTGQFVTLWKRNGKGVIEPYHISDDIDWFVVSARKADRFGQFVFPKKLLHEKGVISDDNKEGKRAIRVYPPWDVANSKQAQKTQHWQTAYFFEIPIAENADLDRVKSLFRVENSPKKTK